MDKKILLSNLNRIGRMIDRAKKAGRKFTAAQTTEAKKILSSASKALATLKTENSKELRFNYKKNAGLAKSVIESLISKEAATASKKEIIQASNALRASKTKLAQAEAAVKNLEATVETMAASPELEKLDKGHASTDSISTPSKAEASRRARARVRAASRRARARVRAARKLRASDALTSQSPAAPIGVQDAPQPTANVPHADDVSGEASAPTYSAKQIAARKRATVLLKKAMNFVTLAEKETDKVKKASLTRKATVIEKMADTIVTNAGLLNAPKRASVARKATRGTNGLRSRANSTLRRTKRASNSISDRVKAGIAAVRGSRYKKADIEDGELEIAMEVGGEAPIAAPVGGEAAVAKSETSAIIPSDKGTFLVNKSETEVVEFPTEDEAKAYLGKVAAKKVRLAKIRANMRARRAAVQQDPIIDSADHAKAEGSEDVSKKLKGLDQNGKGYGTTSKDEKVDPKMSMIATIRAKKAEKAKRATAHNPGQPTDATTTKKPDSTVNGQAILKGLDQAGKGYSATSTQEKVDPKMSMIAAKKVQVLEASNKRQASRLKALEASALVRRAVKVGAISEEQSTEQESILADLYVTSKHDFDAYDRLIANMEQGASKAGSLSTRKINRVATSLRRQGSVMIDSADLPMSASSLESGNFFEED